jgi:hypothetical protein
VAQSWPISPLLALLPLSYPLPPLRMSSIQPLTAGARHQPASAVPHTLTVTRRYHRTSPSQCRLSHCNAAAWLHIVFCHHRYSTAPCPWAHYQPPAAASCATSTSANAHLHILHQSSLEV